MIKCIFKSVVSRKSSVKTFSKFQRKSDTTVCNDKNRHTSAGDGNDNSVEGSSGDDNNNSVSMVVVPIIGCAYWGVKVAVVAG